MLRGMAMFIGTLFLTSVIGLAVTVQQEPKQEKPPCDHPSCEHQAEGTWSEEENKMVFDEEACRPFYIPDDSPIAEGLVPCACWHQHDPCSTTETRKCKAYCDKSKCNCCDPEGRASERGKQNEKKKKEEEKKK